jgi:hypothetical protein
MDLYFQRHDGQVRFVFYRIRSHVL